MSVNQLIDDGAVIGYQPNLQYKKDKNVVAEDKSSSATDYSGKTEYSSTLNGFSNNLPSTALKNLDYSLSLMKSLIDKLSKSFQNGDWPQYNQISSLLNAIDSKDNNYIDKFIKYHKNNISGSIVPELIGLIYSTQQRLEELSGTLKELYYGDSQLTTDEAKKIDDTYLQQMKENEINQEIEKNNYLALSYDSELNRSVNVYSFSVNKKVIDIADVVLKKDDSSSDSSKSTLIQRLFDEVNSEIDSRKDLYNAQQSVEIMNKTLYNYYDKRKESIELYDLFSENQSSIFIGSKIQEYALQLDDSIKNINRTFAGNQYYLSETTKLEREKHFLKNIYDSFSYNSEG
jgi:hypothetical protein